MKGSPTKPITNIFGLLKGSVRTRESPVTLIEDPSPNILDIFKEIVYLLEAFEKSQGIQNFGMH